MTTGGGGVLVWRQKRQRQVPDFLQPCDDLREFATGSRKRGRQQSDDERCTKRACECAAVSAERDDYKQRCEEQAAAHMRLREEVSAIARDAAGGDSSAATAASAMQQALIELLDLEWDGSEVGKHEGEDEGEQSSDESDDEVTEDEVTEDELTEDEEDRGAADREAPSRVALGASHLRGGHVQPAVGECVGTGCNSLFLY